MPQNNVFTEPPPKPADIPLRVYSNPICPFAQRVRLLIAAKGIKAEEINIHLKVKPEWFVPAITPHGQVPVIEHNGKLVRESLIAFDYIDEVFGDKSVWPTDPYEKAMAKLLVNDFGNKFIPNYYKFYREENPGPHVEEVTKFTQRLEDTLGSNNFFSGTDTPGAADLLIWPWLERTSPLKLLRPAFAAAFTEEKFPRLHSWISRMSQNDAVKPSYLPPEAHLKFVKSFVSGGEHDYSPADLTGKGVTIYTKKQD